MQCRSVLTRIDALRTGELDPAESSEVEKHLDYCSSCNESTDDLTDFAGLVRELVLSPPRSCASSVASLCCDHFDSFEFEGRPVFVAFSSKGVRRIDFRSADIDEFRESYLRDFGRELRAGSLPSEFRAGIEKALRGEGSPSSIADLSIVTPFEREVLETIAKIPSGEVRTYEWVARAVNRPKAIRAVGNVMASNPLPFILPCHRVVPTGGGIGNYGYGPEMKRRLLASEGAPVEELETLGAKGIRYIGSRTTKIFCFPTCRDARRIQDKNRVPFHDSKEAEKHGFRPCKRCTPVAA
jgi:O-6-methylguanine DNA methyltransferase